MKNAINTAVDMENKRIDEILAVATDHGFWGLAQDYIRNKKPAADYKSAVLAKIGAGEKSKPISVFAIGNNKEDARPFKSIGEQLVAVAQSTLSGRIDNRLASIQNAVQGASGGVPSDGGFLIQEDFTTALLDKAITTAKIAPLCFHIPLSGNSNRLKAPVINETTRVTGSRWGGVQVYRVDEGAAGTPKKPKTAMLEMDLEKMMGVAYATDELLSDASALGAILSKAFLSEFAWMLDDEIYNGDGAGKCLGIMNAPCLVSVAKETGQTAKTIVAENIINMYSRIPASLIGGAKWFINQDTWPQIFQMGLTIGPTGVPLYYGIRTIAEAPFGTLLGLPILPIEQAKTVGTTGDIVLANFGEYALIEKGGIQADESIHVEFLTDQKAFRWIVRNNGQPSWKSAVIPANGSNSQSPFIALATRA
jgi:HK97 family phage major capsid protein